MLDLGEIERLVGFQTHLPPCSEENYATLAKHHAKALLGWRDSLRKEVLYLGHLQHACRKTGDTDMLEDAKINEDYKNRALDLLNGVEQASPFWSARENNKPMPYNGRGK